MTRRQRRMAALAVLALGLAVATAFTLTAFRKNLMNFYTPSDLVAGPLVPGTRLRLGGLVEPGSVKRGEGLRVQFMLADCEHRLPVRYDGILPDLFREGQGIVATGTLEAGGGFVADEVLAKHDENYVPPQVAKNLNSGGHSCAPFKPVNRGA
ncbi:MAG TPA: cytochrome c maturation protein CcmE [Candidatus Binatia bacterium]|nr:cytochrome c maturation protein CcmE [Candidatus Binatia bacterium]